MKRTFGYIIIAKHEDPDRDWELMSSRVYATQSGAKRRQQELLSHGCWEHVLCVPVERPIETTFQEKHELRQGLDDNESLVRNRATQIASSFVRGLDGRFLTPEHTENLAGFCLYLASEITSRDIPVEDKDLDDE